MARNASSDAIPNDSNIIWLHEAHPRQLELIGSKALNLAVALRLNQPVLPGFVITTEAYKHCLEQTGFSSQQLSRFSFEEALQMARTIQHYLFKQSIPSDILTAIRSAYKQLVKNGDPRVVIRPSLIYNNGVDFAKRLRPILGVKSLIDLEKALKMAWAYMWLDDIIHYRFSQKHLTERWNDLALIIQPLQTPYASGSLLSYLPEKDDQSFVIEAAKGLNEAVSRGILVPDRYVWQRFLKKTSEREICDKASYFALAEQWAIQEIPVDPSQRKQPVLNEADIVALAEISEALIAGYKKPLELEWFKTSQGLQVMQVTPLDAPEPNTRDLENWFDPHTLFPYFEKPFSPFGWSFLEPLLQQALTRLAEVIELPEGSLPEHPFRLQNHLFCLHPDVLPAFQAQMQTYWSELPEGNYRRYLLFLRRLVPIQRNWQQSYRSFTQLMQQQWSEDYDNWGSEQLLTILETFSDLLSEFIEQALLVRVLHYLCGVMFSDFSQSFLPADQVYDILFQGLDSRESETLQLLDQYLAQLQQNADWLHLFREKDPHQIMRELQLDDRGKKWLEELRHDFGRVGFFQIGMEPLYPSWVEAPQVIIQELRDAIVHQRTFWDPQLSQQREGLEAELVDSFSWLELPQRFFFQSFLHLGQTYTATVSEEPYYLAMLIPRLRVLVLALARYLPLDSPQDIFYLTRQEIQEMIQNTMNAYKIKTLRELIQARKYKRRITHRLGPEAAGELKALELNGRAASRGEALGKVRLVTRSEDLKALQPGEIIVTDYFEPFWEQALESAGGLIMELGGVLSHGSMLARYYKLPAVAAVPNATKRLKTGLIARLDGTTGQVLAYQEDVLESQEEFLY